MEISRKSVKFLVGVLLMSAIILVGCLIPSAKPAQAASVAGVVVIDPGHGYKNGKTDSGSVAPDGTREADLNVQLAYKIATQLKNRGYSVYSTLYLASDIPHLMNGTNISLQGRAEAANSVNADVFISVHHNTSGKTGWDTAKGTLLLWDGGQLETSMRAKSNDLANLIFNSVKTLGYTAGNRGSNVVNQGADVLRYNKAAAVTLETGFVNNQEELARLKNDSYQTEMAKKVADGVDAYVNKYVELALKGIYYDADSTTAKTTFDMSADISTGGKELKDVKLTVWNTNVGRDATAYTYTTQKMADGRYHATFDLAKHGRAPGKYSIEVYATDTNGKTYPLGYKYVQITSDLRVPTLRGIYYNADSTTYKTNFDVSAVVDPGLEELKNVQITIWNTDVGRDATAYTYTGQKLADGAYHATFDISKHGNRKGRYSIEVYATDASGKTYPLGYKHVTVQQDVRDPELRGIYYNAESTTYKTNFDVSAVINPGAKEIKAVQIVAWNTNTGRNTSYTYNGTKLADGGWHATFDLAKHGGGYGKYSIEVYATDSTGKSYALGYKHVTVQEDTRIPELRGIYYNAKSTTDKTSFDVSAVVTPGAKEIKNVQISIWNTAVGRNGTTYTYNGTKLADGAYHATFDWTKHGAQYGRYSIEVYATDASGKTYALGYQHVTLSDQVTPPTLRGIYYDAESSTHKSMFDMSAVIAEGSKEIKNVRLSVWNTDTGRGSTHDYTATKLADGGWHATFNLANFNNTLGQYSIEVYATDASGKTYALGYKHVNIKASTPIMGTSQTTVAQMVNFFKASGKAYPLYYEQRDVDLPTFAKLYYDICKTEGVRAEVAWAQMCLETGYLQYGGDCKVEQFNFAGLGATGGGNPGYNFAQVYGDNKSGIMYGIIGHVQHLKCYASTAPVVYVQSSSPSSPDYNKPVDPRWSNSLRGTAPTVEMLSNRWASSSDYGIKVAKMIDAVLGASTAGTTSSISSVSNVITAEVAGEMLQPDTKATGSKRAPVAEEKPEESVIAYPIMHQDGAQSVAKEQMINYYIENAGAIPMELQGADGKALAVDEQSGFPLYYGIGLDEFVQMYLDEAAAEGVNPEVAFVQAMADTNFLRFGDVIGIEDYVFAAADASGEEQEISYADVREGIRAQIQHLKCYASEKACVNPIVDKQWNDEVRGTVQDVAMLGKAWYQKAEYGDQLLEMVRNLLAMSAEPIISVAPETSTSPSPETSTSPSPETSASPSPETSTSPSPETSTSPSPETSTSPSPETSTSPSPETSTSPSPETSTSPSPETSTSPEAA